LEKIDYLLLNKSKENEELVNIKEIIDLDINRTHFDSNVEEKRKVFFISYSKFFLILRI
jgi:hypothetical protein